MRILLGGSPCQKWSVAQKNNRETEAEGIGWELFKNYLIAKEKFKPDYFLYENNKSAAQPIKDQISKELGVPLQYINSSLLSAQNRQRFYAHNIPNVPQPEDRGILLRDVLDSAVAWQEKAYALTTRCSGATPKDTLSRHRHTMVAEPINTTVDGKSQAIRATCYKDGIRNLVGNEVDKRTAVAEPVCVAQRGIYESTGNRSTKVEGDKIMQVYEAREDGKTNALTTVQKDNAVAEPVDYEYIDYTPRDKTSIKINENSIRCAQDKNGASAAETFVNFTDIKIGTLTTAHVPKCIEPAEKHPKAQPIYEVKNGLITIKDKQHPIKLADGYYIIRKLTVSECRRLQTIPDWYIMPCSNSQNYKMLGNGWTVEVIKHILSHIPNIQSEPIEVLSMYDGMAAGMITLRELNANVKKYYASEIDKYCIQTSTLNFPDIIQLGDAFDVRTDKWVL